MNLTDILRKVELFNGLTESELQEVASICNQRHLKRGEHITTQGQQEDELFIVTEGFIEIILEETKKEPRRVVVNLGEGQIIGEMSLVDLGPRSATARAAIDPTTVQVIRRPDFEALCEQNARIGYMVMRNIASDLSFKLRHRNLSEGSR
jgi:CRP/FNR family transcriptional regulator/CRP/FNR family cyclic AMP-dependent transcriptional regulator